MKNYNDVCSDVYALLGDYCVDIAIRTGEEPTREQMKAALDNFMNKFYENNDE